MPAFLWSFLFQAKRKRKKNNYNIYPYTLTAAAINKTIHLKTYIIYDPARDSAVQTISYGHTKIAFQGFSRKTLPRRVL